MKLRTLSLAIVTLLVAVLALVTISFFLPLQNAKGAGTTFSASCKTATATTSPNYLTAGTATTTLSCFLGNEGAKTAALRIQLAGSSTASTLNIDVQYSQDGIDWYAPSLAWNIENGIASTSPALGVIQQYTLPFASTTISKAAVTNANSATSTRIVQISTPTRYVRAVFSIPPAASAGAVWAEIQGLSEY